ncbi:MAG: hypothetical protein MUD14_11910 [Hydrococcus sp. Prado102]|jgi:hypothetical protein|nr:hypothetical protein [Hydrococcus sp. Prado102]
MSTESNQSNSIQLIVHSGHAKCGSSSIQKFIYSNIQYLKKLNTYIPDKNFRFLFDTKESLLQWEDPLHYFGDLIFDGTRDVQEFETRLKEIIEKAHQNNCKKIIISSENLGSLNAKSRKVHEALASHFKDITIIYYIRTQDNWIVSSWQQWTHKEGENFQDYLHRSLNSNSPDFLKIAEFLEEIYGKKSLMVVPLHKKALINQNLIDDFCERAQIQLSETINTKIDANKGLNLYLCDVLARIPNVYESRHDLYVKNLFNRYVSSKNLLYKNDKDFLDYETRVQILKHFERDNRLLQQKYFDYVSYDDIFNIDNNSTDDSQQKLEDEIENLKDVIAIQMEMILTLLRRRDEEIRNSRITYKLQKFKKQFYQKFQTIFKQ